MGLPTPLRTPLRTSFYHDGDGAMPSTRRPAFERSECRPTCWQRQDISPCARRFAACEDILPPSRHDSICANILSAMRQSQFYCSDLAKSRSVHAPSPVFSEKAVEDISYRHSLVSSRKSPVSVQSCMHPSLSIAESSYIGEPSRVTSLSASPMHSVLHSDRSSIHPTLSLQRGPSTTSKPSPAYSSDTARQSLLSGQTTSLLQAMSPERGPSVASRQSQMSKPSSILRRSVYDSGQTSTQPLPEQSPLQTMHSSSGPPVSSEIEEHPPLEQFTQPSSIFGQTPLQTGQSLTTPLSVGQLSQQTSVLGDQVQSEQPTVQLEEPPSISAQPGSFLSGRPSLHSQGVGCIVTKPSQSLTQPSPQQTVSAQPSILLQGDASTVTQPSQIPTQPSSVLKPSPQQISFPPSAQPSMLLQGDTSTLTQPSQLLTQPSQQISVSPCAQPSVLLQGDTSTITQPSRLPTQPPSKQISISPSAQPSGLQQRDTSTITQPSQVSTKPTSTLPSLQGGPSAALSKPYSTAEPSSLQKTPTISALGEPSVATKFSLSRSRASTVHDDTAQPAGLPAIENEDLSTETWQSKSRLNQSDASKHSYLPDTSGESRQSPQLPADFSSTSRQSPYPPDISGVSKYSVPMLQTDYSDASKKSTPKSTRRSSALSGSFVSEEHVSDTIPKSRVSVASQDNAYGKE